MSTLLLRLAGPLQAWGSDSRFTVRHTQRYPTKSGVLGLLAAAQGRPRDADVSDLVELVFGVRGDQGGALLRDFHTAQGMPLSTRYYLEDAVFVVGVEGPREFLDDLHEAVLAPKFPLFLGRRSCPATGEISLGVRDGSVRDALATEEWRASEWFMNKRAGQGKTVALDVWLDASDGDGPGELVRDVPVSYDPQHRRYEWRDVVHYTVQIPNPNWKPDDSRNEAASSTAEPDWYAAAKGE